MKLQTQIPLQKQTNNLIDYRSNILLIGSCFAGNIGNKFEYFKFKNLQNTFGVLFQPKAIETIITNAINEKEYSKDDVFFHNEQWHCFDAHSKLSNPSKKELLHELNEKIHLTALQLKNATHIIITLGTAWIYRFIETNKIVANCHKLPQKQFAKELLSVEIVSESLHNITSHIKKINNKASIIFTVSPVRHLRDGFVENTRSKAHLITAIHQFLKQKVSCGVRNLSYFPAYEIMLDELRDYRFYNQDMLHPNKVAIDYIWEKFQQVWIASEATKTMSEVDAVQKATHHKPFHPESESNQQFIRYLEKKINQLQSKFPHIQF